MTSIDNNEPEFVLWTEDEEGACIWNGRPFIRVLLLLLLLRLLLLVWRHKVPKCVFLGDFSSDFDLYIEMINILNMIDMISTNVTTISMNRNL